MPKFGRIEGTVTVNGTPASMPVTVMTYNRVPVDDGNGNIEVRRKMIGEAVTEGDGTYRIEFAHTGAVVVTALPDYGEVFQPDTPYSLGTILRPTAGNETGYIYICTVPGVSGPDEPAWWVNTGGDNTGSVGTATFEAVESYMPIAHAPIQPEVVESDLSTLEYNYGLDEHRVAVVSQLDFGGEAVDDVLDLIDGNTWTKAGGAALNGIGELVTDGDGDYLQHSDVATFRDKFSGLSGSTAWTLELRVKPSQVASATILFDWRANTQDQGIVVEQRAADPKKLSLYAGDSNVAAWDVEVDSDYEMTANEEVEIAITRTGNDYLFHVAGLYAGKGSLIGNLELGAAGLRFGEGRSPGTQPGFAGRFLRWRATAGVARYQEGIDYLPEGETSSYAWQAATDILNHDFESGLDDWTLAEGSLTTSSATQNPSTAGSAGFYGGDNNQGGRCYQDISVPSGTIACDLSAWLEKTFNDTDNAGVWIRFFDDQDAIISGYGQQFCTDGDQAGGWLVSGVCLVPPNASTARVGIYAGRPANLNLNAGGDDIEVQWLTSSGPFPALTPLPLTNADFWQGNLSGWTVESGSVQITSNPAHVETNGYAVGHGSGDGALYQTATIPPGNFSHAVLRGMAYTTWWDHDHTDLDFIFRDDLDNIVMQESLRGPNGAGGLKSYCTKIVEVPPEAVSVTVRIEMTNNSGQINAGADDLAVEFFNPSTILAGMLIP